MTHPINPPEDLIKQWRSDGYDRSITDAGVCAYIAQCAAQWGADEELMACCKLLDSGEHAASYGCHDGNSLKAARRPKPLSRKQQAKRALSCIMASQKGIFDGRPFKILKNIIDGLPDD